MELSIRGLQEAQQANLQAIHAMRPSGALGEAVKYGSAEAHRSAVVLTPWDYGALRASHRIKLSGLRGVIAIDPGAVHPRSGVPPSVYGPILHTHGLIPGLRGGVRAFYRAVAEFHGARIAKGMRRVLFRGLP
ncbi:MAG: hypothetical protein JXA14_26085 [Anaerolineae bacterium]|nr:hypothetical protein [Anaerolineae bacterium]